MLILKIIGLLLLVILALLLIAVLHTLLMPGKKSTYVAQPDPEREKRYAEKLSKMIRYETVSYPREHDVPKFEGFHDVLKELFPRVFQELEVTDIDGNLLIYWKGKKQEKPLVGHGIFPGM